MKLLNNMDPSISFCISCSLSFCQMNTVCIIQYCIFCGLLSSPPHLECRKAFLVRSCCGILPRQSAGEQWQSSTDEEVEVWQRGGSDREALSKAVGNPRFSDSCLVSEDLASLWYWAVVQLSGHVIFNFFFPLSLSMSVLNSCIKWS